MKATQPRHGRKVTIEHLEAAQATQRTHHLYCPKCHGTYSAEVADYFWAKTGKVFKCCKVNNWLIAGPTGG